jgi:hypothetical protein
MKKMILAVTTTAILTSAVTALAVDWAKHPHLNAGREHCNQAIESLRKANDHKKTEFGGHRANAIKLIEQAEKEIQAAADYAESNAK